MQRIHRASLAPITPKVGVGSTPITGVRSALPTGFEAGRPGLQRCVFLDMGGVLVSTSGGPITTPAELDARLLPRALDAAARLTRHGGTKVVVVTNLAEFTDTQARDLLNVLVRRVAERGGRLDAIYFCPNAKTAEVPPGELNGRKPGAGMLVKCAQDFGPAVDLADSYIVGDSGDDFGAGKNADPRLVTVGVEPMRGQEPEIFVAPRHRRGAGPTAQTGGSARAESRSATPDVAVQDLEAFVEWFLTQEG